MTCNVLASLPGHYYKTGPAVVLGPENLDPKSSSTANVKTITA